jgi:hypothetical protein
LRISETEFIRRDAYHIPILFVESPNVFEGYTFSHSNDMWQTSKSRSLRPWKVAKWVEVDAIYAFADPSEEDLEESDWVLPT